MIYDAASRTIQCKIVYFGCAMSGKTTSLRYIFEKMGMELKSLETEEGRTLFYDCGKIIIPFKDYKISVDLWSATGQDFYASTRPIVLTGADGVVFVADSLPELSKYNQESWRELRFLIGNNCKKIPIIITLNKRDIEGAISLQTFINSLHLTKEDLRIIEIYETTALKGTNIVESLGHLIKKVLGVNT